MVSIECDVVGRALDPQDPFLLIYIFNRLPVEAVFDPHPLHSRVKVALDREARKPARRHLQHAGLCDRAYARIVMKRTMDRPDRNSEGFANVKKGCGRLAHQVLKPCAEATERRVAHV